MTGRHLVDVGMPAHGRPQYIGEAIESVVAQTYGGWRLLILDDAPPGGPIQAAVEAYLGDERIDYYAADEPMTSYEAMTRLMQAGSAPFYALLQDDDRWEPEFMARRLAFMEAHPECGLVFSGHRDIDGAGRITGISEHPFHEGMVPRTELIPRMLDHNEIRTMHSVLARRSALELGGNYLDGSFGRLYDWELWQRLCLRVPVGFIDSRDAHYRVHDDQMSGRPGVAADFLALADHADRLAAEHAPDLRLSPATRSRQRAGLMLSLALDELEQDDPRAARRSIRRAVREEGRAAVLHSRFGPAAAGAFLGRPGRRLVGGARAAKWRRGRGPDRPPSL